MAMQGSIGPKSLGLCIEIRQLRDDGSMSIGFDGQRSLLSSFWLRSQLGEQFLNDARGKDAGQAEI